MSDLDQSIAPWYSMEPEGVMLRPQEVVKRVGLSRSQIYQMIAEGRFPPFVKLSERASAMPETWLNAFVRHCADTSLDQGEGK